MKTASLRRISKRRASSWSTGRYPARARICSPYCIHKGGAMDFRFTAGSAPLLISMPHVGTDIPDDVAAPMAPCAFGRADTDWRLEQLYAFAAEMGGVDAGGALV